MLTPHTIPQWKTKTKETTFKGAPRVQSFPLKRGPTSFSY